MSDIEVKEMQKKIDQGIKLAQERLIERTKKENGDLIVAKDGEVKAVPASEL